MSFQGTWSNLTTYAAGDAVFFNGSSYIGLANGNTGNTPTNGAPWALLAQQGATGPAGAGAGAAYQGRHIAPTTSTAYTNISGSGAFNANEDVTDTPIPIACTFNRLFIQFRDADVAHDYTFTLRRNGISTALTCSLTTTIGGNISCANTTPVAVAANDMVDLQIVDNDGGPATGHVLYALACQ